jgi:putative ABC transport system permease protein
MARRLWPNQDPIGKRVRTARQGQRWLTVVGVVGDVSDSHFPGVPLETWYVPFEQHAESAAAERIYLMVRSAGDALALAPSVQRAIVRVDKTLAPYRPAAMDAYYAETIVRERVSALFMLGFGAFGLGLAALGVYGVMAFITSQRTLELGIRVALGATVGDVLSLVLKGSSILVVAGVFCGAAAAVGVNRLLAGLLPEIATLDVQIVCGAAVLIMVTALLACLLSAIIASRLAPVAALRTI